MRELALVFGFITIGTLLGSYLIIPETGMAGIGYIWLAAQGIVSIYAISAVRSRYRGAG